MKGKDPQKGATGTTRPAEEAKLAVRVIEAALNERTWIREGVYGEEWLALSEEQRLEEFGKSRVSIAFLDRGKTVPGIFVRVGYGKGALVEAFVYPVDAGIFFLREAKYIVTANRSEELNSEEEEEVFEIAVSMMLILIDNLFAKTSLWMESMIKETAGYWLTKNDEYLHELAALSGARSKRPNNSVLKEVTEESAKRNRSIWQDASEARMRIKKVQLVDHYDELLKHWRRISKMVNQDDEDWRDYAKAGKFADTPDDLLSRLMNIDRANQERTRTRVSELALEHAARRSMLLKTSGVSSAALSKRKEGVFVTDYSPQQLFVYLRDGKEAKELISENEQILADNARHPRPKATKNAAKAISQDSPERKPGSAKEESVKPIERNQRSAKVQKGRE